MAEASSSETWGQDFVAEVFRTRAVSGCRAKNKFKNLMRFLEPQNGRS